MIGYDDGVNRLFAIESESAMATSSSATMPPKTRTTNFSKKDKALADRLLREYDDAIAQCGKGDKTKQTFLINKAYAEFMDSAERRDTTRDQFRKFLSQRRGVKAAKSGSSSHLELLFESC